MTNLLPKYEKIKVRREYKARVLVVAGIVFGVFIFSATIPLVISYFAISYNVSFINEISDNLSSGSGFKEMSSLLKITKDTNRKINLLTFPLGKTNREGLMSSFSFIFEKASNFNKEKGQSIKITQITYEQIQKKGTTQTIVATSTNAIPQESGLHKIVVRGSAKDRKSFLSFLKILESEKNFIAIDSPVSNLVESENINFYVTITLKDNRVI